MKISLIRDVGEDRYKYFYNDQRIFHVQIKAYGQKILQGDVKKLNRVFSHLPFIPCLQEAFS